MSELGYSADEIMTVAAARQLHNDTVCFVGIGMPSAAANLARLSHAPQVTLIYESGTIEAKPDVLPLSIADSELSETAMTVVSIPEMFRYWLQGGWIDVGFLGAAQIDRFANINTTVIGEYGKPVTRLPGAGGAPEIATSAKEIFVMLRMSQRAFMAKLDFVTSLGHGTGAGSRAALGAQGKGPTRVITDLGILEPHPETRELELTSIHPGIAVDKVKAACGWPLKIATRMVETPLPTNLELSTLREFKARSEAAGTGRPQKARTAQGAAQ
jgi:glutaconate CoA-transferase subunit B